MVSCGSQERCERASTFRAIVSRAEGPFGTVDFSDAAVVTVSRDPSPVAMSMSETIAAGDPTRGIDENRRQAVRLRRKENVRAASRIHGDGGGR